MCDGGIDKSESGPKEIGARCIQAGQDSEKRGPWAEPYKLTRSFPGRIRRKVFWSEQRLNDAN